MAQTAADDVALSRSEERHAARAAKLVRRFCSATASTAATADAGAAAFAAAASAAGLTLKGQAGQRAAAEWVGALVRREKSNSFGLKVAPLQISSSSRRSAAAAAVGGGDASSPSSTSPPMRGAGCYPLLALTNHGCIPNVARAPVLPARHGQKQGGGGGGGGGEGGGGGGGPHGVEARTGRRQPAAGAAAGGAAAAAAAALEHARITLVALHDIPAGSEILTSYVDVRWPLFATAEASYHHPAAGGSSTAAQHCPECSKPLQLRQELKGHVVRRLLASGCFWLSACLRVACRDSCCLDSPADS
jgi:hypothetical protein